MEHHDDECACGHSYDSHLVRSGLTPCVAREGGKLCCDCRDFTDPNLVDTVSEVIFEVLPYLSSQQGPAKTPENAVMVATELFVRGEAFSDRAKAIRLYLKGLRG